MGPVLVILTVIVLLSLQGCTAFQHEAVEKYRDLNVTERTTSLRMLRTSRARRRLVTKRMCKCGRGIFTMTSKRLCRARGCKLQLFHSLRNQETKSSGVLAWVIGQLGGTAAGAPVIAADIEGSCPPAQIFAGTMCLYKHQCRNVLQYRIWFDNVPICNERLTCHLYCSVSRVEESCSHHVFYVYAFHVLHYLFS